MGLDRTPVPKADVTTRECLFFVIPPELRLQILELALNPPRGGVPIDRQGMPISEDAKAIFLVSRRMNAEAAPIYYRTARIDLRGFGCGNPPDKCARQFLRTALGPQQHVRHAIVCLSMVDCCDCESVVSLGLERHLRLRRLTVLIGPDYPYPPYGCGIHPPTRPRHFYKSHLDSGEQVTGPVCLKENQYQEFLKFLQRPGFGKVTVKVHRYHLNFLCQFHEPDKGRECRGEWRGAMDWIPLDLAAMVRALAGVGIDDSVAAEKGCVTYGKEN
jgi:hypothetical protein